MRRDIIGAQLGSRFMSPRRVYIEQHGYISPSTDAVKALFGPRAIKKAGWGEAQDGLMQIFLSPFFPRSCPPFASMDQINAASSVTACFSWRAQRCLFFGCCCVG